MTSEELWSAIASDSPREWVVLVDGSFLARENSTAATVLDDAARWLSEALLWGMDYGVRRSRVVAICPTTAERIAGCIEVVVTPEMGSSDMA